MAPKYEGLLDNGRFEDVDLKSATWRPVRPARWSLDFVRPEFFTTLRRSSVSKKPVRRTAWLDGLRGFAAFLVYLHHNQLWAHNLHGNEIFENGFGYKNKRYFAALPFVRNFFSGGHYAVAMFFVISGYVLSVKSLGLIQKGQYQQSADGIGSALFRRWFRLYFPVFAVSFVWMSQRHWTRLWVDFSELKPTYGEDVWNFYVTFKNYSYVFTGNFYDFPLAFHPHSWSIPVEFRGSIIIYTALCALAKCTRNARLWCEVGLMFYFLYIVDGWYGALFISGMFLCDLDLLALEDQLPRIFSMFSGYKEFVFFHLFIFGMYLGGAPSADLPGFESDYSKSPGWKWLGHLKPQAVFDKKWFFLFWAAFFTVASIPRLPLVKRFFESRICQYLARISFALYLVHGYVIWSLGDRLYAATGFTRETHKQHFPNWMNKFPLSKAGPMGLELAFWGPQLIILPVTLYAAEVVTKLFDEPSVKMSNWLYNKALGRPSSPKR
ncbi:acyltransferas-like protein [Massarina eburnea CBS 473.64]|uniref:Acyltransferas-like protein n=1 Tax=Massarina eburnea CBS 473.64 TaxID=1395130 RepID=A0A6A6RS39_9PLEO|nr:acyltransferas-like protein [Massarina eburnea CBS 473.64]